MPRGASTWEAPTIDRIDAASATKYRKSMVATGDINEPHEREQHAQTKENEP